MDETQAPQPKISLTEFILIGLVVFVVDIVEIIIAFIPIADVIEGPVDTLTTVLIDGPIQLYLVFKGVSGTRMLIGGILELIPYVNDLPLSTIGWCLTCWVDQHPKLEKVTEIAGTFAGGEAGAVAGEAGAAAGAVAEAGKAAEEGVEAAQTAETAAREAAQAGGTAAEEESVATGEKGAETGTRKKTGTRETAVEEEREGGVEAEEVEETPEEQEEKKEKEKELSEALGEEPEPMEKLQEEFLNPTQEEEEAMANKEEEEENEEMPSESDSERRERERAEKAREVKNRIEKLRPRGTGDEGGIRKAA